MVPTFNRIAMLERVLDALAVQSGSPPFEVIVVNDGSTDDTVNVIESRASAGRDPFPFHFRSQPNSGPGRARNYGVTLASGRFVIFIGDDTVPEREFLAGHRQVHEESGDDPLLACLGYTGWPLDEPATPFMDFINDWGLQFGYRMIEDGSIVPFNFFYTSNISLDRELLLRFPFDTRFPSAAWEDIELAYRLDARGLEIRYNAKAVTRHHHPMTIASFARRQYTVGKSGAVFYDRHPELRHFLGVEELRERGISRGFGRWWPEVWARLGERSALFARNSIFYRVMRQHYLEGLRDGLREQAEGGTAK